MEQPFSFRTSLRCIKKSAILGIGMVPGCNFFPSHHFKNVFHLASYTVLVDGLCTFRTASADLEENPFFFRLVVTASMRADRIGLDWDAIVWCEVISIGSSSSEDVEDSVDLNW